MRVYAYTLPTDMRKGFDTLAVDIWSAANELLYAEAATSALMLLAVSAVPMYLLVLRRKDAPL